MVTDLIPLTTKLTYHWHSSISWTSELTYHQLGVDSFDYWSWAHILSTRVRFRGLLNSSMDTGLISLTAELTHIWHGMGSLDWASKPWTRVQSLVTEPRYHQHGFDSLGLTNAHAIDTSSISWTTELIYHWCGFDTRNTELAYYRHEFDFLDKWTHIQSTRVWFPGLLMSHIIDTGSIPWTKFAYHWHGFGFLDW